MIKEQVQINNLFFSPYLAVAAVVEGSVGAPTLSLKMAPLSLNIFIQLMGNYKKISYAVAKIPTKWSKWTSPTLSPSILSNLSLLGWICSVCVWFWSNQPWRPGNITGQHLLHVPQVENGGPVLRHHADHLPTHQGPVHVSWFSDHPIVVYQNRL